MLTERLAAEDALKSQLANSGIAAKAEKELKARHATELKALREQCDKERNDELKKQQDKLDAAIRTRENEAKDSV
jgi:hypothetical protein